LPQHERRRVSGRLKRESVEEFRDLGAEHQAAKQREKDANAHR